MKKHILIIFSLVLASVSVKAQELIFGETSPVSTSFSFVDLTSTGVDLEKKVAITNNTNEVLDLKWTRTKIEQVTPVEWKSQICDNNFCYGFDADTNYEGSPDLFYSIQPGETSNDFALHVWPEMTPGCGQYIVRFSRITEPEVIIGELLFNVSVNTPDCVFLSSTKDQQAVADVTLYPNPSFGQFTLTDNEVVKQLTIYNILGKQVKHVNNYFNGDYVDVAELVDGMYLVALQNADGQTLKTLRLLKRNLKP